MIQTLEWTNTGVVFIDQTKLPTEEVYVTCTTHQQVADVIRNMVVRGAPAIGVAAAMGIALGVKNSKAESGADLKKDFDQICEVIGQTRPTAVNLFWAIRRMTEKFESLRIRPIPEIKHALIEDGIPTTVISDNMAGVMMQQGKIGAIVVGADRIAANGDVVINDTTTT